MQMQMVHRAERTAVKQRMDQTSTIGRQIRQVSGGAAQQGVIRQQLGKTPCRRQRRHQRRAKRRHQINHLLILGQRWKQAGVNG